MPAVAFADVISFTRGSSGTRVNASGLIETITTNNPRFDHDPATLEPLGLLVEEQRTNLLINSVFANSGGAAPTSWTSLIGTGTSAPATSTRAPALGAAYAQSATAERPFLANSTGAFTWSANSSYTLSVEIEAVTGTVVASDVLRFIGPPAGAVVSYPACPANPAGSAGGAVGPGKLVCVMAVAATAGSSSIGVGLGCNGNVTGTLRFSCPQLEAGGFESSYIPTAGSQATRSADVPNITGADFTDWYDQAEGTFVVDYIVPAFVANRGILSASDGTLNNVHRLLVASNGQPDYIMVSGGVSQLDRVNAAISANAPHRSAIAFAAADFAICTDGGAVSQTTAGSIPTVDQLNIGANAAGTRLYGHIRSLRFYPRRLTNAELQDLTA